VPAKTTYREILKSSAVIGGASVANVAIGIIRTKVMAVLLGPAGVGLLGLYTALADLAKSVASMGINGSGVRQIAEAAATGDTTRIAQTVTVLRRTTLLLACTGAALLALLSAWVSTFMFGTEQHAHAITLLSLVVLFRVLADGQVALIQGTRRIADFARMGVLGALLGTIVGIGIVYVLREDGVVPSLVAVAAMSALMSWWYGRKVVVQKPVMTRIQLRDETRALLKLGVAFLASGFLMLGAAYAVRMILLRTNGLEATGLYESAWTIGGLYVGFVLQAMGADFYPRLVGVANDNAECNRLVNEQMQVSLLLAAPGVIATLTLAPLAITIFYSNRFAGAVDILRWVCLGMALRVITWPVGYIIVAKGRQVVFLATEVAWTVVNVGLAWLCVNLFGPIGAGIAFFGSYVFHAAMILAIVRSISRFRWSQTTARTGLLFAVSVPLVFGAFAVLSPTWATCIGIVAMILSGLHSVRALARLVSPPGIARLTWRLGRRFTE
jgi:PST family polysaccharide transporter